MKWWRGIVDEQVLETHTQTQRGVVAWGVVDERLCETHAHTHETDLLLERRELRERSVEL